MRRGGGEDSLAQKYSDGQWPHTPDDCVQRAHVYDAHTHTRCTPRAMSDTRNIITAPNPIGSGFFSSLNFSILSSLLLLSSLFSCCGPRGLYGEMRCCSRFIMDRHLPSPHPRLTFRPPIALSYLLVLTDRKRWPRVRKKKSFLPSLLLN